MEIINVFICNQTYLLLYNYSTDVKGGQVFAKCLQSLSSIGINYEWNPFDLLITVLHLLPKLFVYIMYMYLLPLAQLYITYHIYLYIVYVNSTINKIYIHLKLNNISKFQFGVCKLMNNFPPLNDLPVCDFLEWVKYIPCICSMHCLILKFNVSFNIGMFYILIYKYTYVIFQLLCKLFYFIQKMCFRTGLLK